MIKHPTLTVVLCVAAISALAWIDPVYIPLITLGPVLSGLAAGAVGADARLVALTWFAAGVVVLLTDLAINQEDVAFHAVVAGLTATLGGAFAALGGRLRRRPANA
jgi:hypothetical protein